MAPIISEATAAVVLAALISTKSSATAVDGKGKCDNGAARPRRQRQLRQRPITAANKVLAWGGQQRRQTDNTNQIQFEADLTTRPSLDEAAYPKAKAADGSWTHAAFRAFHEMRAGRPPQSAFDQVDEVDDAGPLAGFRRLTAGLNRYAILQRVVLKTTLLLYPTHEAALCANRIAVTYIALLLEMCY